MLSVSTDLLNRVCHDNVRFARRRGDDHYDAFSDESEAAKKRRLFQELLSQSPSDVSTELTKAIKYDDDSHQRTKSRPAAKTRADGKNSSNPAVAGDNKTAETRVVKFSVVTTSKLSVAATDNSSNGGKNDDDLITPITAVTTTVAAAPVIKKVSTSIRASVEARTRQPFKKEKVIVPPADAPPKISTFTMSIRTSAHLVPNDSSFGSTLEDSGSPLLVHTRDSKSSKQQKKNNLKVISMMVYCVEDADPIEVTCQGVCSIQGFIQTAVKQWYAEQRQPALPSFSDADYELRMCDDPGEADMDLPPFDCNASVYGVLGNVDDGVVLVFTGKVKKTTPVAQKSRPRMSIAMNDSKSSLSLIKVHLENHSIMFKVTLVMTLLDLIKLVKAKRKDMVNDIGPEKYNWFYWDPLLGKNSYKNQEPMPMHLHVCSLQKDSLLLQRKVPKAQIGLFSDKHTDKVASTMSDFVFSKQDFQQISYYSVIKTNERGRRQKRRLGIDAKAIYNEKPSKGFMNKLSSAPLIGERPIQTVMSCQKLPNQPKRFVIQFQDHTGNLSREYETEYQTDCAEIVAKVNFLINNHTTMR